jgi:hypothetical protein
MLNKKGDVEYGGSAVQLKCSIWLVRLGDYVVRTLNNEGVGLEYREGASAWSEWLADILESFPNKKGCPFETAS